MASTSINDDNEDKRFREHFWTKLQNELGMCVPPHIKNILKFHNLDNPVSFRGISEEIISELETFTRTAMLSLIEDEGRDLKDYYGIFHKNPENFKFVVGDKLLLKLLVDFVRSKPFNYWGVDPSTLIQNQMSSADKQSTNDISDIDTETEKKKLQRLLKPMLTKNWAQLSEQMQHAFESGLAIDVKGRKNLETNDISYEATITCSICSTVIRFTKISGIGRTRTRWIISNFKRHIKKHFVENINRTNVPEKNMKWIVTEDNAAESDQHLNIFLENSGSDNTIDMVTDYTDAEMEDSANRIKQENSEKDVHEIDY